MPLLPAEGANAERCALASDNTLLAPFPLLEEPAGGLLLRTIRNRVAGRRNDLQFDIGSSICKFGCFHHPLGKFQGGARSNAVVSRADHNPEAAVRQFVREKLGAEKAHPAIIFHS